jgi:hypothetical protein
MLNILHLYNSSQTYTNTVYEHISSFCKYSRHQHFYHHLSPTGELNLNLSGFDAVAIHYSLRLPFDELSASAVKAISSFAGLKILFIQDEYDNVHRTWHWIKTLGLQLVFTVVPKKSVEHIYPHREFPGVSFVSVLTGYVPDSLNLSRSVCPPSQRNLMIGYRGRSLPIRYGQLGVEKIAVGALVKEYCDTHGINADIAWDEDSRIYGPQWYEFMISCRSMLGSESGSNVFDWDGTLVKKIVAYQKNNPKATDVELYERFIKSEEIDGVMNQVSPRIFEAVAAKTILVLFEGNYSGVLNAGVHFIPLKKDGSNLRHVTDLLKDGSYVDAMADRAYKDVIESGRYSYQSFVRLVDEEIDQMLVKRLENIRPTNSKGRQINIAAYGAQITKIPIKSRPPQMPSDGIFVALFGTRGSPHVTLRLARYIWWKLPESTRRRLKTRIESFIGNG